LTDGSRCVSSGIWRGRCVHGSRLMRRFRILSRYHFDFSFWTRMNADKREPTLAEAPSLPGAKLGHDCNGWLGISNIGQNHEHRSFPERRTWPISGYAEDYRPML